MDSKYIFKNTKPVVNKKMEHILPKTHGMINLILMSMICVAISSKKKNNEQKIRTKALLFRREGSSIMILHESARWKTRVEERTIFQIVQTNEKLNVHDKSTL